MLAVEREGECEANFTELRVGQTPKIFFRNEIFLIDFLLLVEEIMVLSNEMYTRSVLLVSINMIHRMIVCTYYCLGMTPLNSSGDA